jgi:hypothetical protein
VIGPWEPHPLDCTSSRAQLVCMLGSLDERACFVLCVAGQGIEVTPLDANHCPGAVMFLFRNPK